MTTERWKPVSKYEGSYEVSDQGRVRSLPRTATSSTGRTSALGGKLLRPRPDSAGYLNVNLCKHGSQKTFRVHQLVLEAFVGVRPAGIQCCHNNGIKANNQLENLRYDTPRGNQLDRRLHGTSNEGERHGLAVLTEKSVIRIRELRATGNYSLSKLAKMFGVSKMTVSDVTRFRSWQHVGGPRHDGKYDRRFKLTEGDVNTVRALAATGVAQKQLARQFGVHRVTIGRIVRHERRHGCGE